MQLNQALYDLFSEQARNIRVTLLSIGLRYTAVATDDGGTGIAYTDPGGSHCGSMKNDYRDFEGLEAVELLSCIKDTRPLFRSMALALVNALNHAYSLELPEDPTDAAWMDVLGIGQGTRLAMVGFFRPLMQKLADRGAQVEVLDHGQGIGDRAAFYKKLETWADALILTSTSILNSSTEEVLGRISPSVKVAMLGPSTPMTPEAFRYLPVRILAGTVVLDQNAVLKAIRHGAGTPVIHRFSRKVYALMKP
jgi:uncharacterized protein